MGACSSEEKERCKTRQEPAYSLIVTTSHQRANKKNTRAREGSGGTVLSPLAAPYSWVGGVKNISTRKKKYEYSKKHYVFGDVAGKTASLRESLRVAKPGYLAQQ